MVKHLFTYLFVASSFLVKAQEISQFSVEEVKVPLHGEIYSPTFKDSVLIVCGTRKDRILYTHLDKNGKEPIDLYVIELDSGYKHKRFDQVFRSDFHDGPISFNSAGNQCVVSRNLRLDQRFKAFQKDENQLGLFQSNFENDEWTTPEPLIVNSKEYNCTHPALSADGNTLIFSSNMTGGFGGYDLWKLEKINGNWGNPENLGKGINSSSNEFFPTFIGSTIYFSSNREIYGGLDIYRVDELGENAKIRILDEPLNSDKDDFGFISNKQGKSGYFSSNRNGSDRLWSYNMEFPSFENCDSLVNDDFCYTLLEETAYELGGIASLVYEWDINGVKKFGYEIDYCFPGPGEYEIKVDIIDTVVKLTYANQANYTLELSYEEQPYITSPDSIQIGQQFTFDPSKSYLPGVEIESYYWILSDGTLFTAKTPNHAFDKPGVYQVTLGIIGTKDGQPFKDCSYKMMVATEDSISQTAISLVKPMKTLENEGQVVESDPPKTSEENATVVHSIEIAHSPFQLPDTSEILEPAKEKYMVNTLFDSRDSMFVYSIGEWLSISEAHPAWLDLLNLGYKKALIFTHTKDSLGNLPLNRSFTLENVQFATNKWELSTVAKQKLEVLVLLLKEYEDMRLLISAHTDDVGSNEDNLRLSINRAKAISNYITSAGIDASRLVSEGFGENKPIESNETPEGRSKNRRVEFTLVTTEDLETIKE